MTTRQRYNNYVNGQGFCCTDKSSKMTTLDSNIGNGNDDPEKLIFFYHSDHLGSTSYVTNLDGNVVQHVEYIPFGEVFIEERNNVWNTPYLFNSKELDEETGLYYYGARYYNPRESVFLSVDPLVEKTGTPYQYCYQNPVKFVDPLGMEGTDIYEMDKQGNLIWRAESARDVIYTSDQFKDGNLISGSKGYDIGDKGYIADNSYSKNGNSHIDFGGNQAKGMDYFNQVADWTASGNVNVEFAIQTANVANSNKWGGIAEGTTPHTVVGTSGGERSVSPVYSGAGVSLMGHTHPGFTNYDPNQFKQQGGELIPSGYAFENVPQAGNNYNPTVFYTIDGKSGGDNAMAGKMPNAINFIYAPSRNTTIIYGHDNNPKIRGYESKYDPKK